MKNILITGMPRSGSTFFTRAFYDLQEVNLGPYNIDKVIDFFKRKDLNLYLEEPGIFSKDLDEEYFGSNLKKCYEYNKDFLKKDFFVIRHHNLINFPEIALRYFDSILICKREYESWIKSASIHEGTIELAKTRCEGDLKELYLEMKKNIDLLSESNKVKIARFDNIQDQKDILYNFFDKNEVDYYYNTFWTGSRHK
jgi:hypothetical protein